MDIVGKIIKRRVLILDGATGTNLLKRRNVAPGESPSVMNIRDPDSVFALHQSYVAAGSDIILTNTLSANGRNFASKTLDSVIRHGVHLAKRAANKVHVVADVGPLGDLIKPYGHKDFEDVVAEYKAIYRAFTRAGLRRFFIETFTSIIEAKAAYLAAKDYADSIYVCLSFQDNGRTIMGETPEAVVLTFDALGADAVGVNCTTPDVAVEVLSRMRAVSGMPLIAKPNAGRVSIENGIVKNSMSEAELIPYYVKFVRAGANMIGGCCGTTPEFIKAIARKKSRPRSVKSPKRFFLVTPGKVTEVVCNRSYVVGERLNPSGRKKLRAALKGSDYKVYGDEAKAQERAGADAIDINAFVDVLEERATLTSAVHAVMKHSSLPVFIDTQDYSAAESVLRCYPGIGVYNSIPARRSSLKKWLPLVQRCGFKTVISLVGKRIPKNSKERIENAKLALAVARELGFPVRDLIFDPLVFPAATGNGQIEETLKALRVLHRMRLKTILGISNVSYGLPDRSLLNAALAAAAAKGNANFLILNPLDENVMGALSASGVLFGSSTLHEFIERRRAVQRAKEDEHDLVGAIVNGNVDEGVRRAKTMIDGGMDIQELTDGHLSRALEEVGRYYDRGEFFIPDLLKAAEVAQAVLDLMKRSTPAQPKKGKIVVATVRGDIHDIGKNQAAMLFESAGYEVFDLGKDVAAQTIVQAARMHSPDFVGLSALLTTTMPEMEKVIAALRKAGLDAKVIIGGPNVSIDYARKIGAFGAARNAFEGLRLVKKQNRATQ
ncbi:MAG: homocysteine S-methyltransferase family protein [candidate division WOR-3 bacterium]|nr:MAG: homocysteine S-methyltransferase family protein [candidate division WOR-3 bacterium]